MLRQRPPWQASARFRFAAFRTSVPTPLGKVAQPNTSCLILARASRSSRPERTTLRDRMRPAEPLPSAAPAEGRAGRSWPPRLWRRAAPLSSSLTSVCLEFLVVGDAHAGLARKPQRHVVDEVLRPAADVQAILRIGGNVGQIERRRILIDEAALVAVLQ